MKRYDCLKILAEEMADALVICTVGGAAAEWNSIRPSDGNLRCRTLGLVSSIAMGLALALPKRRVVGLDGDGALLMNACGLATLAWRSPANLTLLLFDNGIYEASGLRPTATSAGADLIAMARAAGVQNACWAGSLEEYRAALRKAKESAALFMIGAKTESGPEYFKSWRELPAFGCNEVENLYRFMRHIEKLEGKRVVPVPGPRH
ncbi:MAG TPA: thiamine pyrophosphate-dependent enzyme [candidate division Zixibacteria bacterium]|nr:thiamine pyrophosphate-dependent enzyme [candidate division Zixibacteria bacterium]